MQEETSLVGAGGERVKDVGRIKIRGHADSDILSVLFQFSSFYVQACFIDRSKNIRVFIFAKIIRFYR